MLAREINILKGKISKDDDEWSCDKTAMFDLFINKDVSKFYRVAKEAGKEKAELVADPENPENNVSP
jgi:hypothetical protein